MVLQVPDPNARQGAGSRATDSERHGHHQAEEGGEAHRDTLFHAERLQPQNREELKDTDIAAGFRQYSSDSEDHQHQRGNSQGED